VNENALLSLTVLALIAVPQNRTEKNIDYALDRASWKDVEIGSTENESNQNIQDHTLRNAGTFSWVDRVEKTLHQVRNDLHGE